jgi:hypothetical protein
MPTEGKGIVVRSCLMADGVIALVKGGCSVWKLKFHGVQCIMKVFFEILSIEDVAKNVDACGSISCFTFCLTIRISSCPVFYLSGRKHE